VEPSKNEPKRKRSANSNEETSVKPVRTSDSSSTAIRSIMTSPKSTPSKQRRATTDNGPPKVPSKAQQETTVKSLPIRRQKSEQSSRATSTSAVSDEENEPFVVSKGNRPRRLSGKIKEASIKSTTDNTLPVIPKPSSSHSNPSDQQNLLKLDDSTNDQQWHMVSSNKGQRKGSTPKRDTTDELQTTQKPVKRSSINSGKYHLLCVMHSVFFFFFCLFVLCTTLFSRNFNNTIAINTYT
jgi:hypothetical protein